MSILLVFVRASGAFRSPIAASMNRGKNRPWTIGLWARHHVIVRLLPLTASKHRAFLRGKRGLVSPHDCPNWEPLDNAALGEHCQTGRILVIIGNCAQAAANERIAGPRRVRGLNRGRHVSCKPGHRHTEV